MQNRFITFDKRLQPGADFEEGQIFDHSGFHNIPGFPDNVRVRHMLVLFLMCVHDEVPLLQRLCTAGIPASPACSSMSAVQGLLQLQLTMSRFAVVMCLQGAKTRFFPVLQRGNSTADPSDIQSPSFQACQVLL